MKSRHGQPTSNTATGFRRRLSVLLIVTLLICASAVVPIGLAETTDEPVALMIDGTDDIDPGETTTATVTAEGATEGISAFELTLTLEDDAATFEDVDVHASDGSGPLTDIEHSEDGTELSVAVALLEATHEPADEIDLFDVVLEGHTDGAVSIEVDEVTEVTDLEINQYTIGETDGASFEVGDTDEGTPAPPLPDETESSDLELDLEATSTGPETIDLAINSRNDGDASLTDTIELEVGDTVVETLPVDLDSGETTVHNTTIAVPDATADTDTETVTVTVQATSGETTASAIVSLEADPVLSLEEVDIPTRAEPTETITATVSVSNNGTTSVTEPLTYALEGAEDTTTTANVTVAPDETESVSLELVVPDTEAGDLEQTVTIGTEEHSESLTVTDESTAEEESTATDESVPGFGLVVTVVALVSVVCAMMYTSRVSN